MVITPDHDLQEAIDIVIDGTPEEAATTRRTAIDTLTLAPGRYEIAEPIRIYGVYNFNMFAYGAQIVPVAEMDSLFDLCGTHRSTFHGLYINSREHPQIAQNYIYLYWDETKSLWSSHSCAFYDTTLDGRYHTGIRVGLMGSNNQCDHMRFYNTRMHGKRDLGAGVGVHGFYLGDGVFGNNLCHEISGAVLGGHDTHITVDKCSAGLANISTAHCTVDVDAIVANYLSIRNFRSEHATRFLTTGPHAHSWASCKK